MTRLDCSPRNFPIASINLVGSVPCTDLPAPPAVPTLPCTDWASWWCLPYTGDPRHDDSVLVRVLHCMTRQECAPHLTLVRARWKPAAPGRQGTMCCWGPTPPHLCAWLSGGYEPHEAHDLCSQFLQGASPVRAGKFCLAVQHLGEASCLDERCALVAAVPNSSPNSPLLLGK